MTIRRLLPLVVLLMLCVSTFAHHGTGVSYDASKPLSMTGVVTEFRYANPHPQLYFDVKNEKGEVVHWSGEFYPNSAQLQQIGWGKKRSESVLPNGTEVKITVAPSRAGTPVGAILKLTDAKGEILLGVDGSGPGGGAPAAPAKPESK